MLPEHTSEYAGKPQEYKPGNSFLRVGSAARYRSPTPTLGKSLCAFRLGMCSIVPQTLGLKKVRPLPSVALGHPGSPMHAIGSVLLSDPVALKSKW